MTWISTKERLPIKGHPVLLWARNGDYFGETVGWRGYIGKDRPLFWVGWVFGSNRDSPLELDDVPFWQELPPPPDYVQGD